jgi:hypothetical protein
MCFFGVKKIPVETAEWTETATEGDMDIKGELLPWMQNMAIDQGVIYLFGKLEEFTTFPPCNISNNFRNQIVYSLPRKRRLIELVHGCS